MTADILHSLEIRVPRVRPGEAPQIDLALVAEVLDGVARRLDIAPGDKAIPPELRQQILRVACRRLAAREAVQEALFLNAQAVFDAQAAEFELRLLRTLDDSRRVAEALRRLSDLMLRAWATQVALLELRLKLARGRKRDRRSPVHRSLILRQVHHRVFGPLKGGIRDQLGALPVERFTNPNIERLVDAMVELRQVGESGHADFRRRFLWGRAAKLFLEYLVRIDAQLSSRSAGCPVTRTPLGDGLRELAR